jgi:hypothetical protein
MLNIYDQDIIEVTLRERVRGGWGQFIKREMTVKEARDLRARLAGRTYHNTKPGDRIFLGVSGTLNQIVASGGKI